MATPKHDGLSLTHVFKAYREYKVVCVNSVLVVKSIVCLVFIRGFVFLNMLLINLLFLWKRDERTVKNTAST